MTSSEAQQSLIADIEAHLHLVARLDEDSARAQAARDMLARVKRNEPLSVAVAIENASPAPQA